MQAQALPGLVFTKPDRRPIKPPGKQNSHCSCGRHISRGSCEQFVQLPLCQPAAKSFIDSSMTCRNGSTP